MTNSTRGETREVTPKTQRVHDDDNDDDDEFYYDDEDDSNALSQETDYDPDIYDVNDHDADYQPPANDENSPITSRRHTRASAPRSRPTLPTERSPRTSNTIPQVTPPRGAVWHPPDIGYSPVSTPPLTPVHPRHSPFRLPLGPLPSPVPRTIIESPSVSLFTTSQAKSALAPEMPSPTLSSPEITSTNTPRKLEPPTMISPTVSPILSRTQRLQPPPSSPSQDYLNTSTDVLNFDFRSNTNTPTNDNNNNRPNNINVNHDLSSEFTMKPLKQPGRLTVKSGSFPALKRTQSAPASKGDDKVLKKVWKEFDSIMKKDNHKKTAFKAQLSLKKVPSDPVKKAPPKIFDLNTIRFNKKSQ